MRTGSGPLRRLKHTALSKGEERLSLQSNSFEIKRDMAEPNEPSNDFVEFGRVWRGTLQLCPEAIISYDSKSRGTGIVPRRISTDFETVFQTISRKLSDFQVQIGYKIGESRNSNGRGLGIITSSGATIVLERRKRGNK